jgi:hypothetical protein
MTSHYEKIILPWRSRYLQNDGLSNGIRRFFFPWLSRGSISYCNHFKIIILNPNPKISHGIQFFYPTPQIKNCTCTILVGFRNHPVSG